jgi:hypothetical protein
VFFRRVQFFASQRGARFDRFVLGTRALRERALRRLQQPRLPRRPVVDLRPQPVEPLQLFADAGLQAEGFLDARRGALHELLVQSVGSLARHAQDRLEGASDLHLALEIQQVAP